MGLMAVSRILSIPQARDRMIIYLSDIPEGLTPKFSGRIGPAALLCFVLHRMGFFCLANHFTSGELLPRLFTLTCAYLKEPAVCFL